MNLRGPGAIAMDKTGGVARQEEWKEKESAVDLKRKRFNCCCC